MKKNIDAQLIGKLAYGSINKNQIPGQIQDYEISLVKEIVRIRKQQQMRLKLKFTPKPRTLSKPFFINIDNVKTPANCLHLLKYKQSDSQIVHASLDSKIDRKLIVSIDKQPKCFEELRDDQSQNKSQDSDIPKRKLFFNDLRSDESDGDNQFQSGQLGRPRKRRNLGNNDDSVSDQ